MSILSTERLGHSYHDRWLFEDIRFALRRGDRTALVGANGTGKSTLLSILSGVIDPSAGQVVRESGLRVGYLSQDTDFKYFTTVSDYVYSADHPQQQLIRQYEDLVSDANPDPQRLVELSDQLSASETWEYEHTIKAILSRFQLTDLSKRIDTLSGGQRKRLALAKLLIDEPDVYILDEPTNHLDIQTIEWLEKWLVSGHKTVLLVTHDRYFLDRVCNSVHELEAGDLRRYSGNYGYYLEKRAERLAIDETTFARNRNLLRRELEWVRRQPQARGTKSKTRIDAYNELKKSIKPTTTGGSVQLSVKTSRLGGKVMELDSVSKSYNGQLVINAFSYVFKRGDRIGLTGRNGTGKTTLLDLIVRAAVPDAGAVIIGSTVVFGYYRQYGLTVDPHTRVIDVVQNVAEYITMANGDTLSATQLLTFFLFPPEKQFDLVSKLSGGERKRLLLMRVLMRNPNVLILDEPGNDLDIDTLNVLEEFLLNYPGVLLMVSHDRYLLDRLTDQLFIFQGEGKITLYNGTYESFQQIQPDSAPSRKVPQQPVLVKETKAKLTFKERKEYEQLEVEIVSLERQISEQSAKLNKETDYRSITEVAETIKVLTEQLDIKMERWLALDEYIKHVPRET